jgi:hypothetical protein
MLCISAKKTEEPGYIHRKAVKDCKWLQTTVTILILLHYVSNCALSVTDEADELLYLITQRKKEADKSQIRVK